MQYSRQKEQVLEKLFQLDPEMRRDLSFEYSDHPIKFFQMLDRRNAAKVLQWSTFRFLKRKNIEFALSSKKVIY